VTDPATSPDLLAVLAEPNRRRLLSLLQGGEKTVTELAAEFAVTRPAVSQHLGVLAAAGLVEVRRDGRFRRYRLRPEGMASLRHVLDSFWTSELELLARGENPSDQQKGRPDDD
jgi:DNA-binding transcriptional ArsR family regulator